MEFSGDIGLWQRRIAECPEGASRRLAVFEALMPQAEMRVLDVGCGSGHLVSVRIRLRAPYFSTTCGHLARSIFSSATILLPLLIMTLPDMPIGLFLTGQGDFYG